MEGGEGKGKESGKRETKKRRRRKGEVEGEEEEEKKKGRRRSQRGHYYKQNGLSLHRNGLLFGEQTLVFKSARRLDDLQTLRGEGACTERLMTGFFV